MVKIPVSIGELFDKITILEIKSNRISDTKKLFYVNKEYNLLNKIALKVDQNYSKNLNYKKLKKINDFLWDIEDGKRQHEKDQKFDKKFIYLARQVYLNNDERARIKLSINKKYNSQIVEVKSHSKK
jgi:hypothetical protein